MEEGNQLDRAKLKKSAHRLKPVVMVGQKGFTDAIVKAVDRALEEHELIKVRFVEFKEERRNMAEEICRSTGSVLVDIIGNVAILFRKRQASESR